MCILLKHIHNNILSLGIVLSRGLSRLIKNYRVSVSWGKASGPYVRTCKSRKYYTKLYLQAILSKLEPPPAYWIPCYFWHTGIYD
jgi:hypothetical protein